MELGIFELLYKQEEPISAENFGKKHEFKPDILPRLFNCLTAIKLVSKENMNKTGKYSTYFYYISTKECRYVFVMNLRQIFKTFIEARLNPNKLKNYEYNDSQILHLRQILNTKRIRRVSGILLLFKL